MRDRILVVSIPKAGTYLMSQTLTELGYSPTHMHIGENAYSQYDPQRLQEGRDHPSRFRIKADWQKALNNIDRHHFAVSHLAFDNRKLRAMRGAVSYSSSGSPESAWSPLCDGNSTHSGENGDRMQNGTRETTRPGWSPSCETRAPG